MNDYEQFIDGKMKTHVSSGFTIEPDQLHKKAFDFQKHIVAKALRHGRYAIFAECGLGKTFMQLMWADQVAKHTRGRVLILAPLAVSGQTIEEGRHWGIAVSREEDAQIQISNYEQLHKIDTSVFSGVVLDESSILKNFTGKTKRLILEKFEKTPYKLACTATPAPNDANEIGNHSEFLDVMDANDMRSRWFVRDEGMNNYRLKGHAHKDFYGWVASWATMVSNPSDIGFTETGSKFRLPPLNIIKQEIQSGAKSDRLFNASAINATDFQAELRRTQRQRLQRVAEIVNGSKEQFIVWIKQDAEGDELRKLIPDAREVRGSEPPEAKEEKLLGFAHDAFRVLITKPKIAQFGLNYQNCHNQVHASLDFSFEALYQAIRRSYRFGQQKPVNVHIITVDTMGNVIESIEKKERQFEEMKANMNKAINAEYRLVKDYEFEENKGDMHWIMKGDTCKEISRLKDDSVDFMIFSPPFSSLFTYSDNIRDMGNCDSHTEFFEHYSFLLRELYRILKPGRLIAVHTKDLAVYKNSSGYTGLYDFTGDNHKACENAGFKYHSKVTIWTDPVLERARTNTQRLLYKQVREDSTYSGVGLAEYLTIFRKWEGSEEEWTPVNNKLDKEKFPLDTWQKWASPVWMDIQRTDVLNNIEGTDTGDEKHIAPLQLGVIERAVYMWTNPGETVFTPFAGIGSELYQSIMCGRKAIGCELKESYYKTAIKNIQRAYNHASQMELAI